MMCRGEMSAVCGSWQKRVSTHGVSFASRDMPGSYACSLLYLSATDQTSFLAYNHVRISSLVFAVSHDWRYREGSWALEVWQKRVSTRGGFLACERHAGSCACSPSLCQPFTMPISLLSAANQPNTGTQRSMVMNLFSRSLMFNCYIYNAIMFELIDSWFLFSAICKATNSPEHSIYKVFDRSWLSETRFHFFFSRGLS
jgi:hypothetical protein